VVPFHSTPKGGNKSWVREVLINILMQCHALRNFPVQWKLVAAMLPPSPCHGQRAETQLYECDF
jgi:hypothetical protein